ncbi:MAG: T9SS type A sorting domain-containing protein [Chitinophagaceae bacterium]
MKHLLTLLCLFCTIHLQAQPLKILSQKTLGGIGNDGANDLLLEPNGDIVLAGYSDSTSRSVASFIEQGWVVKLDANMNQKWSTYIGGSKYDYLQKIIKTSSNNYLAVGHTTTAIGTKTTGGYWAVMLDSNGTLLWQNRYGGSDSDYANDVAETDHHKFLIVGQTASKDGDVTHYKGGQSDGWVICIDSIGHLLWQKTYGSDSNLDFIFSIKKTKDNDFMMLGRAGANNGDVPISSRPNNLWFLKIDSLGTILLNKTFGGSDREQGFCFSATQDGGYILAGDNTSTNGDCSSNYGGHDAWILKLDSLGNLQWQKSYGGSNDDFAYGSVIQRKKGTYVSVGISSSGDHDAVGNHLVGQRGIFDILVIEFDSVGKVLNSHCFGGRNSENLPRVVELDDSTLLLSATTNSTDGDVLGNHGGTDAWLVVLRNSSTTSVSPEKLQQQIKIYPNPASNKLHLELPANEDFQIEMMDVLGRKISIKSSKNSKGYDLDVEGLLPGIYVLKVYNGLGSFQFKFSKE